MKMTLNELWAETHIDTEIEKAFNEAVASPKNQKLWEETRITHTRAFWDSVEEDIFNAIGHQFCSEDYVQDCIEALARDYYTQIVLKKKVSV
jgi:hypothetical protein